MRYPWDASGIHVFSRWWQGISIYKEKEGTA